MDNHENVLWFGPPGIGKSHLSIALGIKARKRYNPGLVISLLLNIPIGAWSILYLGDHGVLPNIFLNPHLFIGLGINLVLPVMGMVLYKKHLRTVAA